MKWWHKLSICFGQRPSVWLVVTAYRVRAAVLAVVHEVPPFVVDATFHAIHLPWVLILRVRSVVLNFESSVSAVCPIKPHVVFIECVTSGWINW